MLFASIKRMYIFLVLFQYMIYSEDTYILRSIASFAIFILSLSKHIFLNISIQNLLTITMKTFLIFDVYNGFYNNNTTVYEAK